jgi:threonine dehydrogenase-like Zn-dependent dehydrogenase
MPHQSAFPLDEEIDKIKAVSARMAQVALTAPQISSYQENDTVAVYGLGMVGNLAAQLFQLGGAKVICLDPVKGRCEAAKACGLKTALCVEPGEQVDTIMDLTGGKGAAVAVDAAGNSRVIRSCLHSVKRGGEVILLGSPRAAFEANMTDDFNLIHMRSLVVKGGFEWRLPPHPDSRSEHSIAGNLDELLGLITAGKLKTRPLISHVVKPAELPFAYFGLLNDKEHYHGVVVDWERKVGQ